MLAEYPPSYVGEETAAASILASGYFRQQVKVGHLTIPLRSRLDPAFSNTLDNVGDGVSVEDADSVGTVRGAQPQFDLTTALDFIFR